ncbi:MAG: GNAT family N-acetyltransferase [Burkholderiaceae bacterium]
MSALPRPTAAAPRRAPHLRDAEPADRPFLLALYASTREEELAVTGWTPEMRRAFVRMQYDAQHADYQRRFPRSRCRVMVSGASQAAIGRLWLGRDEAGLHVLDITLIPALRGCGLGGACLRLVQADAQDHWLPVHLHVLAQSPARRLYERLGFVVTGADDLRLAMTWTPEPDAPPRAIPRSLEVRHEQA